MNRNMNCTWKVCLLCKFYFENIFRSVQYLSAKRLWWEYVTERDTLGDIGVDGRTILKRVFKT